MLNLIFGDANARILHGNNQFLSGKGELHHCLVVVAVFAGVGDNVLNSCKQQLLVAQHQRDGLRPRQAGRRLLCAPFYGTVCVACHAANGTGSAVAPALNDNQWINISGQYPEIVQVITNGVPVPKEHPGPMPPKGGGSFTDPQIRAIAAYVYALSHQGGGA